MNIDQTNGKAVHELLTQAGLDENEAQVYTALLTLSVAPASTIAKHSGLKRSNTYVILESLQRHGLVSQTDKRGRKHFIAENPRKLIALIQEQERALTRLHQHAEQLMPLLLGLQKKGMRRPIVTIYEGLDRMGTIYREIFTHEFIAFFNPQGMYDLFGTSSVDALGIDRIRLQGRELIVSSQAAMRFMKSTEQTPHFSYRLLPKDIQFDGDIIIFGDTVTIFCFDDDLTVIRLDSPALSKALRGMFELCWASSLPPNSTIHN